MSESKLRKADNYFVFIDALGDSYAPNYLKYFSIEGNK